MPFAPNLNPPASSAAVHAAVQRHPLLAGATQRGKNQDSERKRERVKRGTARTEAEFHEPLNRGLEGGVTRELGEQAGLMVEDGGAVEEITAAPSDRHDPEWMRAMGETFLWQRAEDRTKKVSGELIEPVKRDRAWRREELRRGRDPNVVRTALRERRAGETPNPECHARRTVEPAAASLAREIPPQYSNPLHVSDSRSPIDSHRTVVLA